MRSVALLSLATVFGGCRSPGLSIDNPEQPSGDIRSASMSITAVECTPPELASAQVSPLELSWLRNQGRLTVDLYAVSPGVGCNLSGGALVDTVADTLFLFYSSSDHCTESCASGSSHVRFVVTDPLKDLSESSKITITEGLKRPEFSNFIVSEIRTPFTSDFAMFVPAVADAVTKTVAPQKSMVTVTYPTDLCASDLDYLPEFTAYPRVSRTVLIPYVSRSVRPNCNRTGAYFFDTDYGESGAELPIDVLSKTMDGRFEYIRAAHQ